VTRDWSSQEIPMPVELEDSPATVASAEHTVPLAGTGWRLWRTACLRGAGFPARLVLQLAAPSAALAADDYAAARRARDQAYELALERLRRFETADQELLRRLRTARRRLKQRVPDPGELVEDRAALTSADRAEASALRRLREAYAHDCEAVRARLVEIAEGRSFREAARWQTGRALSLATAALRGPASQKQRQATEFVGLLIQRYAVKNDTSGFFGPSGWLEVSEGPWCARAEPSADLTARREVYFETWTLDALTELFDRTPQLKSWACPRVRTDVWLGPDGPYVAALGRVDLSADERLVLAACDGATSARALARRLAGAAPGLRSEDDVYAVLQSLVERAVLVWKFEVAPQLHPERELAARIDAIEDEEARALCRQPLDLLLEARERVARAIGDPEALGEALEAFNAAFERLTGTPAERNHGLMYAARSLLYHDARRAGTLRLGRGFVERLGPPLGILLDGARWVLAEVAKTLRAHLRACHEDLRAASGSTALDAHLFIQHAKSDKWMRHSVPALLEAVEQRLQDAWNQVLVEPSRVTEHRIDFDVESVASHARAVFANDGDGWGHVRQLSPDVMVSAASVEALDRGEFQCVLGELHCGNTITISALAAQHPAPDELRAAVAAEASGAPVLLRQWPRRGWLARANQFILAPSYWRYGGSEELDSAPHCRLMPAGGLLAIDDGERVLLRARDGSVEFDALELFHDWLVPEVNDLLGHVCRRERHTPRITLGMLTVARERWDLPASELAFVHEKDELARFVAAREWARSNDMPTRLFYKTPTEPKPCYLDLDSPTYVNVFARMVRPMAKDARVALTEMAPGVEDAWLADAGDVRYTSELRFVVSPPVGAKWQRSAGEHA
jgi:hypothetical protein